MFNSKNECLKNEGRNIYSVFDEVVQREEKEDLLNSRSAVFWLTGLSGSGKTTIAKYVERVLHEEGVLTYLLDGDNVRTGLCNNLDFSEDGRRENIRRIAEVSRLFVNAGIPVINAFVSPTQQVRDYARDIIGSEDFFEIFIDTPIEECERRDVKGLYKKARAGEIPNFTGISAPFENPSNPALTIKTEGKDVKASAKELINFIKLKTKLTK